MPRFSEILGQENAIDWLTRAYSAGRLPHALIFAGPTGVGKSTTARALGQLFLCESPKGANACGKCDSCRALDSGNHADFHLIERKNIRLYDKTGTSKAITMSIEVIRKELIDPAGLKPQMGVGKVFLIEEADSMQPAAQNSTLKTLEEPAGRTLIILITDSAGTLLPTIRSRCQIVQFAALDEAW